MPKILVIDDEKSTRFTFERFIRDAGCEVETAPDFQEAMSKLCQGDFDLVFADIILGGETGLDILREIRERKLNSLLVFITGYPTVETAADAVRLGAFDYLCKPVKKDTLLRVTRMAMLHKSMLDASERYRKNLEAIFGTVRDAMLMVDRDLHLVEFNAAAGELFEITREDVGKPFEAVSGERGGVCLDAAGEAVENREPVERHRFEFAPGDGPRRVVSLSASPVFDTVEELSGVVMVLKDETRLLDLEVSLRQRARASRIIGENARMREIGSLVDDLANVRSSILITGESGTGKELLAEAIHYGGNRAEKPLVKVNCSALSEGLLESELFGHVRGAFTGAVRGKVGRFQLADGGTILLDEIGDISLTVQQRLLRVLQENEFERVGDSTPLKVDVRIIAATNRDLQKKVRLGEFREDLYYRLRVMEIPLPPLRERRDDIPLLVAHFMDKLNHKLGKKIEAISEDVLRAFMKYPWPGNVRQLAHALEHAFILCHHDIIALRHLPPELRESAGDEGAASSDPNDRRTEEREAILRALERTAGNKAMAARLLGISRRTIHRKVVEYGITKE